jgi:hypothetical protein
MTLFSSVNSDTNNSYYWDFGDGSIGYGPLESYYFSDTGTYLVTLYLTNICGITDTVSRTIYINTSSSPVAAFSTSPYLYSCPGQPIEFINLSSDTTNVLWSFGDGDSSIFANLSHTYSEAGNYFVILQVTNSCGLTSSTSQLLTITASDQLGATVMSCTESGDSITFSWDSVAGATGYNISIDSGITWVTLANDQLYYSLIGVQATSYSAIVRALGPEYCLFGAFSDTTTCQFQGMSFEHIYKGTELDIYPNPGTGIFHIKTSSWSRLTEISVFDILGRTVLRTRGVGVIDLSAAPVGTYVVMIQLGEHKVHRRIVIYR